MAKTETTTAGIGLPGLLTVLFVALRLIPYKNGHIINWSWWWVLSPLWITWGIVLLVILVILIALTLGKK